MDIDDFRAILESSGVDVWTVMETAITVASIDFGSELKQRRDKIVEGLYAASSCSQCKTNCDFGNGGSVEANNDGFVKDDTLIEKDMFGDVGDGGDLDPFGGLFDDEQTRILEIKQQLEDSEQNEESLLDLLQSLVDMDITLTSLKETDIGRHVNKLRKHSSNDVRRMVKHLVRKWKDIVDEWVGVNPEGQHASSGLMAYEDSPQQKIPQSGHHQGSDFPYSSDQQNGSSGSEQNNSEPERKSKPVPSKPVPRKEVLGRPTNQRAPVSVSASHSVQRQREQQKESEFDPERLALARKRLQANYKEAENAKKQRTIQVMDIHEIPKNKKAFFPRNRGGGSQGKRW